MGVLLRVQALRKYFPVTSGILFSKVTGWVKAVDGIDFDIAEGETFGLVGESGCGKTTTARMILLEEEPTSGSVLFRERNIFEAKRSELRLYRASVQAVFQDPYSSLSPRMRVGSIISEALVVQGTMSKPMIKGRVEKLLRYVGLNAEAAELYPHEFSGGQRQRIAIARSLALNPSLVVLDEPVSGLDVSIRAQIMNLLKELQEELGVAYLLIAHDLATVKYMSHRVAVMYLGKIVEFGPTEELFSCPLHPYTRALLSAVLPYDPDVRREDIVLRGEVPSALDPPSGCRFHPRCYATLAPCSKVEPDMTSVSSSHMVACHLYSGEADRHISQAGVSYEYGKETTP